jgi:hypothetical protein
MMSAAAVLIYFPSPRGFGGIGDKGNVTGGGFSCNSPFDGEAALELLDDIGRG